MPWTLSDPPRVARNKSKPEIEACVAAANDTLRRTGSEDQAIFACVAALKKVNKAEKAPEKPQTTRSFATKGVAEGEPNLVRKAVLGPDSLDPNPGRSLVKGQFDDQNRLVLTFDTGETITTKPIAVQQIVEQYIGIKKVQAVASPLEGYRLSDEDSPLDVKYYGYVSTTGKWYVLRVDNTTDPIEYRYANLSNNPTAEDYIVDVWTNRASLNYLHLQQLTDLEP